MPLNTLYSASRTACSKPVVMPAAPVRRSVGQDPGVSPSQIQSLLPAKGGNMRGIFSGFLLVGLLFMTGLTVAEAPAVYTAEELWEIGNLWKRSEIVWMADGARYKHRKRQIKRSGMSEAHQDYFLKREWAHHRAVSQQVAVDRHHVHQALTYECSARASKGSGVLRQRIEPSLGTPIESRDFSGVMSDLDATAGLVTAKHVREVLRDMGLDHLQVIETPATIEIKGPFDLTLHKQGLAVNPGSEMHHLIVRNNALNKEVFVSQSMGDSIMGGPQAGRSQVEVQDHIKKATPGLKASPQRLATDPNTMQILMKSTGKAIVAADISDADLQMIMNQRQITGTAAEFRQMLNDTKARRALVTDPAQARKLQAASQDILNHADNRTMRQAQADLSARTDRLKHLDTYARKLDTLTGIDQNPELAARKRTLRQSIEDQRIALRNEVNDSNAKINATRRANELARSQADGQAQRQPTQQITRSPAPGGAPADARTMTRTALDGTRKAAQVYAKVTDFTDIGHLGQSIEDYIEGNAPLTQVIRSSLRVPPLNVTLVGQVAGAYDTIEGTSRRLADSIMDARDASATIRRANEQNLEAYLTQWELRFRTAGLTREEARRRVALSVKAGDLDMLEVQAEVLRAAGQEIESPVLVIEEGIGPDGGKLYMFYNGRDVVYGMADSVYQGGKYIIEAPGRVVEALGERELNEAILHYDSTVAETDMQVRLFRALLQSGIDSERALRAVHDGGSYLREIAQEARQLRAEADAEEARQAEELARHQQRVNRIIDGLNGLYYMDLRLHTSPPSPVHIPFSDDEDFEMEFEVSLGGGFQAEINRLERHIASATGEQPHVTTDFQLLFDGAEELDQGKWLIRVPAIADVYPLHAHLHVTISGLTGENEKLHRVVRRDVIEPLSIRWAEETIELEYDEYEFTHGDYEDVFAIVSGASEDRDYYFYWTFRDRAGFTDGPQWKFSAILDDEDTPLTDTLTVMLADMRTGTLLDEAHALVTIVPAETGEHSQDISVFANRTLWMTTSIFGNDLGVRLPDVSMRVTPSLEGAEGLVPEGSPAGLRLANMLEQMRNPQAHIRQQFLEELERSGAQLSEAQINQAMRQVMAFAGSATGVDMPGARLIDRQYVKPDQALTLSMTVNLPRIPPIRMRLLEADESQRVPRAVDARMQVEYWQILLMSENDEVAVSQPMMGNNATTRLSWRSAEMSCENPSLILLLNYSVDIYRPDSDEPVMIEGDIPLRFEGFNMQYPLGFYFLPTKEGDDEA